jgi:hypothetical protein
LAIESQTVSVKIFKAAEAVAGATKQNVLMDQMKKIAVRKFDGQQHRIAKTFVFRFQNNQTSYL